VDIGKKAYTTSCRFFRDSDEVGTIEWREALPDAEVLPFASGIVNLDYELDKGWYQQHLGEVWGTPRVFNPARPPKGLKGTPCGTERDFLIGGIYDDDRPPIHYTKSGYPLCCGAVVVNVGGAGASGFSVVNTNLFVDPAEGGFEFGGEAGDKLTFVDPAEGGFEFGGEAGDVFVPGYTPLPPGTLDCAIPTPLAVGVLYTGELVEAGAFRFWTVPGALAGTWHVTISGMVPTGIDVYVYYTIGFCNNFNITITNTNGCVTKVVPSGGQLAIVLYGNFPNQPISLRIDPGPCPGGFVDPAEGGFEFGGEAGDRVEGLDPAEGGFEFGGEAGDVYETHTGNTCADAIPLALASPQSGTVIAPGTRWWKCVVPTAGTYQLHGTLSVGGTTSWECATGPDCNHLTILRFGNTTNVTGSVTPDASLTLWITISNFSSNVGYTGLEITT
jgi:hypothetical protein